MMSAPSYKKKKTPWLYHMQQKSLPVTLKIHFIFVSTELPHLSAQYTNGRLLVNECLPAALLHKKPNRSHNSYRILNFKKLPCCPCCSWWRAGAVSTSEQTQCLTTIRFNASLGHDESKLRSSLILRTNRTVVQNSGLSWGFRDISSSKLVCYKQRDA